jgi:hypothetical protein
LKYLKSTGELTPEEKQRAMAWRLLRCGSIKFEDLFKEFAFWVREKSGEYIPERY